MSSGKALLIKQPSKFSHSERKSVSTTKQIIRTQSQKMQPAAAMLSAHRKPESLGPVDIHLWIALPLKWAGCKAPARRKAHALQERVAQQTVPFSGNPHGRQLVALHSSLRSLAFFVQVSTCTASRA